MNLIWSLLRASWPIVVLAAVVGAASGAASVTLVSLMLRTLKDPNAAASTVPWLFAGLCALVLVTRLSSQFLLSRLMQGNISRLRLSLCKQILETPLVDLEKIGHHRLLASLTGDVDVVSRLLNGLPGLGVNFVILACGTVYLGTLSLGLLAGATAFALLGVATYYAAARRANWYVRRARESHDFVIKNIRELIDGIKELKLHRPRNEAFVEEMVRCEALVRESKYLGDCFNDAAAAGGRLQFFVAIGLLLFAWPRLSPIDGHTLTGYALTIMYLSSPLEQIVSWFPMLTWARVAVEHVEKLGLQLGGVAPEPKTDEVILGWSEVALCGVTHSYRTERQPLGFVLGPIDLTLRPGEIVFVVGGNGSGKTTLAKLIVGLYHPEAGEVRLDGRAVLPARRQAYRQLFSVVFDDPAVFDTLWGISGSDLDARATDLLRRLHLDHAVTVNKGVFSSTKLSRGQRKRLSLVAAYLEDRPIYVFDEWAADQDPVFKKVFYLELLPELKSRGKTVVAITHDDRYFSYADRLVKLEEGKLVETERAGPSSPA